MTHKGPSEDNLMEAFHLFDAELRYTDDATWLNRAMAVWQGEFDERIGAARYTAWVAADDVPAVLRSAA